MVDLNRYTSTRLNPGQTRGKERIRLILATALRLFREKGIDQTTTNEIAKAAHIPIGSIYRYFKNKEDIILAITDLQVNDVVGIFEAIATNPLLPTLSWYEVQIIITDAWIEHAKLNDSLTFLYFLRCNRRLIRQSQSRWEKVNRSYVQLLEKRGVAITPEQAGMYLQMTWSAVELGISSGEDIAHQAVAILADHLEKKY